MPNIAEQVFEAVIALPEQQAAEVLDFAEFLQAKMGQHADKPGTQASDDDTAINPQELARVHDLKAFLTPFQKDLTEFKFDREEANVR